MPLLEVSGAVGVFTPLLAAILKQDRASKRVNTIIALVVSVAAGVLTAWLDGQLTAAGVAAAVVTVHAVASAMYAGLWQPSGLEPSLQSATSVALGQSKAALTSELAAVKAALAALQAAQQKPPAA